MRNDSNSAWLTYLVAIAGTLAALVTAFTGIVITALTAISTLIAVLR